MKSSSWKSPYQRTKKERQQPLARQHLGILEKKKDFIARAKIYHKHENELKQLRREAELKNPNEFYFSMVTDNKKKPEEFRTKSKSSFTKEQLLLLETQSIEYVRGKITSQQRKIEKLQQMIYPKSSGSQKIYSSKEEFLEDVKKNKSDENIKFIQNDENIRLEIEQRNDLLRKLKEVYNEMEERKNIDKDENFKEFEDDDGNIQREWNRKRKR